MFNNSTKKQDAQVALLNFDVAIKQYLDDIDKNIQPEDWFAIQDFEHIRGIMLNNLSQIRRMIKIAEEFELNYITQKIGDSIE